MAEVVERFPLPTLVSLGPFFPPSPPFLSCTQPSYQWLVFLVDTMASVAPRLADLSGLFLFFKAERQH